MRIQFEFNMKQLPRAYRLFTLSIIKEMVKQGSKEYYEICFQQNKLKMKPFSHASFIQNLQLKDNQIFGDKLILTVSSSSYEFIMHLINGSQRNNFYKYKDYELKLSNKRLLPKSPQLTEKVFFKTLSPMLIEDSYGNPLLHDDENFEKEFNYYAGLLAKTLYHRQLYRPIQINVNSAKKMVIQENLHQHQNDPIFITANHGVFLVSGDPRDLEMIYQNGIGRRRSLGFGLLDIEEVTYDYAANEGANG